MIKFSRWIQLSFLFAMALSLTGCAMRQTGYKIDEETVAFIQPGETSRAEVIENLGPPLMDLPDVKASAYSWGKLRATGGKPAVRDPTIRDPGMDSRQMGYGIAASQIDEGGLVEWRRWVCCIAWDANDRVRRVERIQVEPGTSVENAVRSWAGANQ